ncbi:MAG: hypothetical protein ACN6P8_16905, partial [Achromobacter piechaudii]
VDYWQRGARNSTNMLAPAAVGEFGSAAWTGQYPRAKDKARMGMMFHVEHFTPGTAFDRERLPVHRTNI